MKLLADENFPKASVLALRSLGYDVKSIGEDNPSISDPSVMEIANEEQRVILTFDRDYGELIYKHNLIPQQGVIYLRLDKYSPEEPALHVHQLLSILKIETRRSLTVYDGLNVRQRKY